MWTVNTLANPSPNVSPATPADKQQDQVWGLTSRGQGVVLEERHLFLPETKLVLTCLQQVLSFVKMHPDLIIQSI